MILFSSSIYNSDAADQILGLTPSSDLARIIGHSSAITTLKKSICQVAKSSSSIFITGESGTGKELVARAVHGESLRSDKPFVAVNCAALPESLLESELFGYVKGAFTGANPQGKKGLLETAQGGTFFMDEIGDMSPAAQAKVLHIDIDRAEINKNVSTTLHITGDARVVLELLLSRVAQKANGQWMQQARSMMEEYLSDELFEPRKILRQMAAIAPEITVATDVGQHQMWTAQHFPFLHPRQLITSGGLGTMGFGLGAAMGAAASDPAGRPVALVTGDGSFRMNLTELSTIGYYGIPVIVVIFNNGTLGMVRQWQTLFFGHRYSQTTLDRGPDFMKLAAAYGLSGARVDTVEAFAAAFKAAVEKREPCIIECMLDIDEMVAPMVAPGSPIDSFCLN